MTELLIPESFEVYITEYMKMISKMEKMDLLKMILTTSQSIDPSAL